MGWHRAFVGVIVHTLVGPLVGAGALAGEAPRLLFPNPVTDVGVGICTETVSDFTGDGRLDLAFVDPDAGQLRVLLGKGDGTFGGIINSSTDAVSAILAQGDLNADGAEDLVLALGGDMPGIGVFLGASDGTFRPAGLVASGIGRDVVIADFNGDGRLDFAGPTSTEEVSVFLGNGDGAFGPTVSTSVADLAFVSPNAGDFNNDRVPDLAVGVGPFFLGEVTEIAVLLGAGGGKFRAGGRIVAENQIERVEIADLNADGWADLVAASANAGVMSVYLNQKDGNFRLASGLFMQSGRSIDLALADLDRNGNQDAVVRSSNSSQIAVALGNGDGTFAPRGLQGAGAGPCALVLADLDADGRPDLTASNPASESVVFMAGNGDGTFGPPVHRLAESGVKLIAGGDLDGDGKIDLALAGHEVLLVMPGKGDGSFDAARSSPGVPNPGGIAVGDLNEDGFEDIVVGGTTHVFNAQVDTLAVTLNDGTGTFEEPATRIRALGAPRSIAIVDLNGDAKKDLVVVTGQHDPVKAVKEGVSVYLGAGEGTFGPPAHFETGIEPRTVAVGDFNNDGNPDLAVGNVGEFLFPSAQLVGSDFAVLLGRGDGTFEPPSRLPAEFGPFSLAAEDLDRDGNLDLLVANTVSSLLPNHLSFGVMRGEVALFSGNGDGSFQSPVRTLTGFNPIVLRTGDFDGDSITDVVTANRLHDLSVFLAEGGRAVQVERRFGIGGPPSDLFAGDLNGDGRDDLAALINLGPTHLDFGLVVLMSRSSAPDSDADGVPDGSDNCPPIANPSQGDSDRDGIGDACEQEVIDIEVRLGEAIGRGAALLTWRTTHEIDLAGFNVIARTPTGDRVQLNEALIRCAGCTTGVGQEYAFPLRRHRGGRGVFVEMVRRNRIVETFGPAVFP